jgi:hypothetical protein
LASIAEIGGHGWRKIHGGGARFRVGGQKGACAIVRGGAPRGLAGCRAELMTVDAYNKSL